MCSFNAVKNMFLDEAHSVDNLLTNVDFIRKYNALKSQYSNDEYLQKLFTYLSCIMSPNTGFYEDLPLIPLYAFVTFVINGDTNNKLMVIALGKYFADETYTKLLS